MDEPRSLEDIFNDLHHAEAVGDKKRKMIKMPFGWGGGKVKTVQRILEYLPYHNGFIDVFGGSGVVGFTRVPSELEVYNDRYGGVVDFYRCLRNKDLYPQMVDYIKCMPYSREEWYNCYDTWSNILDPIERAAKWYYSLVYSFGKQGTAFGHSVSGPNATKNAHIRGTDTFQAIHERIQNYIIENADFRTIFEMYGKTDDNIFYCDPPYLNQQSSKAYFGEAFTKTDHIDLLKETFRTNCFVAISGHESFEYDRYPWDNIVKWEQTRCLNHGDEKGGENGTVTRTEVLYIKERK